jgi:hypothetical protein
MILKKSWTRGPSQQADGLHGADDGPGGGQGQRAEDQQDQEPGPSPNCLEGRLNVYRREP